MSPHPSPQRTEPSTPYWAPHKQGCVSGNRCEKIPDQMLKHPKTAPPVVRERKQKQGRGWPMLKQKAAQAVLRAARNGQSAGRQRPQRPHVRHPERMKVQSTPLKNIGKPRVSRMQKDIQFPAARASFPAPMTAVPHLPSTMTRQLLTSRDIGKIERHIPIRTDFITNPGQR